MVDRLGRAAAIEGILATVPSARDDATLELGLGVGAREIGAFHDHVREAARARIVRDRLEPGRLACRLVGVVLCLDVDGLHDVFAVALARSVSEAGAVVETHVVALERAVRADFEAHGGNSRPTAPPSYAPRASRRSPSSRRPRLYRPPSGRSSLESPRNEDVPICVACPPDAPGCHSCCTAFSEASMRPEDAGRDRLPRPRLSRCSGRSSRG